MICYAVIDTNVLVSALLSSKEDTATVQVVGRMIAGEIIPVFSKEITREYREVLRRKKFGFKPETIDILLSAIEQYGISVEPTPTGAVLPDRKDLPFYEVVMEKQEEDVYLVTGNIKATPQDCVYGAFWKNSTRILLRKLEIRTVFLRFRAAFGHYFSGEIALAELYGVALSISPERHSLSQQDNYWISLTETINHDTGKHRFAHGSMLSLYPSRQNTAEVPETHTQSLFPQSVLRCNLFIYIQSIRLPSCNFKGFNKSF